MDQSFASGTTTSASRARWNTKWIVGLFCDLEQFAIRHAQCQPIIAILSDFLQVKAVMFNHTGIEKAVCPEKTNGRLPSSASIGMSLVAKCRSLSGAYYSENPRSGVKEFNERVF
jgi:hypothetical protein